MTTTGTRIRLFLTCWIIFCLHFATDFVREHYLVVSMVEDRTFDLTKYVGLHEDIFENPPNAPHGGAHHGANPGISMLAAVPYALLRPIVDRVVAASLAKRKLSADTAAIYDDPRPARVRFYRDAWRLGLDVRFGLVGMITLVLCMAPLSALGVVVMHRVLEGAGVTARTSLALSMLYAIGTPVLFRSAYLNQNLAIGIVAFFGFLLLWDPGRRLKWSADRRTAIAGLCGGFAFLCDYSGALATGLLGLYAMSRATDGGGGWRAAIRSGALYTAGAIGPIVLLWFYQWSAFGNPILPPQHWMPPVIESDKGYQGVTGPRWDLFQMLLADTRFGLFVAAPLLVLALGSPWLALRRRGFLPRREILLCLGIGAAYVVFFSAIHYTRLQWSTGIRYLMPVVPFLFLAAAAVLVRMPRMLAWPVATVAIVVSVSMAMARNQYGMHQNVLRVFLEGVQLPWLTTFGKMSAQYAPWLEGRPSAIPAILLCGAVIALLWRVRDPWTKVDELPSP